VKERIKVQPNRPRCPYCHDDGWAESPARMCPACDAWQHDACWLEASKCATCGFEAPKKEKEKEKKPKQQHYFDQDKQTHVYVDVDGKEHEVSLEALKDLGDLWGRGWFTSFEERLEQVHNAPKDFLEGTVFGKGGTFDSVFGKGGTFDRSMDRAAGSVSRGTRVDLSVRGKLEDAKKAAAEARTKAKRMRQEARARLTEARQAIRGNKTKVEKSLDEQFEAAVMGFMGRRIPCSFVMVFSVVLFFTILYFYGAL